LNSLADAEMARLETMAVINQATNLLAGDQTVLAIGVLETQLRLLESDSTTVTLPQIMGLRSVILDLLDSLKKKTDANALLSRMTSVTTSLATQRNSAHDSPALERLYTSSAMRSQTANMTAEYDSIIRSNV
jgi:hypothetical protein